jgi:integrase
MAGAGFPKSNLKTFPPTMCVTLRKQLSRGNRAPATVSSYLTHVCHILAEDDFGPAYHVCLDALDRGKRAARRHGLAGKSKVRERRPTDEELEKLMQYFSSLYEGNKRCIPMHYILAFAIFGCRRQSEITSIKWDDFEEDDILVRGMKHPRRPEGIDTITTLTDEAKRIIALHGARGTVRIFPYNPGTISRQFTDACKLLGIKDLHFHDLWHEGISWVREKGWSVSHTMMVSGHSSTQTLDRYSKLRIRNDRYENWQWFDRLEKLSEGRA